MKNVLSMLCFMFILCIQARAQDSTKQTIKTAIDAKHFVFQPTIMTPVRGRAKHLDPGYFFKVSGDTLKVYLPYVGRAYSAPIDPSDAGFDFTSTSYNYAVTEGKKKSYDVTIKTNDKASNAEFYLTVYDNGSAYLRANSPDRESISYNGDVQEK